MMVRPLFLAISVFACTTFPTPASTSPQSGSHNIQFWQSIAANHYAVPEGGSAAALARELSANLASPDPNLRDELSYSILYVWIVRKDLLTPFIGHEIHASAERVTH